MHDTYSKYERINTNTYQMIITRNLHIGSSMVPHNNRINGLNICVSCTIHIGKYERIK